MRAQIITYRKSHKEAQEAQNGMMNGLLWVALEKSLESIPPYAIPGGEIVIDCTGFDTREPSTVCRARRR